MLLYACQSAASFAKELSQRRKCVVSENINSPPMKSLFALLPTHPPTHVSCGATVASWFNVLVYGLRGTCSSPGWGHCIVLLGKTLDS